MKKSDKFNPTPISKLFITLMLGISLLIKSNEIYTILIVFFIAVCFALNNRVKTAIKVIAFFTVIEILVTFGSSLQLNFIKNYIMIFVLMAKIFFLPFLAGKFLIDTSDVSSLIVSFEKLHFPTAFIIPIAVMFRYFPVFKDDRKNIKRAMRMRGITFKNPIKYLEYVSVPLLVSALNIGDDISKAAETKCIADPVKKVRYVKVNFGIADIIYVGGILGLRVLGGIYA